MLVTFTFTCQVEPEGSNQKVVDYTMSGSIQPELAAQLLQQIQIMEAVKKTKEEARKELKEELMTREVKDELSKTSSKKE